MSVRRRDKPLDILKKLPIVRSVHDLSAEDETRVALLSDAELLQAPAVKKKKLNIPIGDVRVDASYAVPRDYVLPKSYVKHSKRIGDEADITVDYIAEEEDITWLMNHPKLISSELAKYVTVEALEVIFNLLEKHTATGDPVPMVSAEKLVCAALGWPSSVTAKIFSDIYQYWIAKRLKLHKPLCRKYWPATAATDTNPLLVFRPREKERYKLRKHRRNDLSSFRKLQSIRREFAKARILLQLIHERELLKKARLEAQTQIFEQMIYDATNSSDGPPRCPEGSYKHTLKYDHLLLAGPQVMLDEEESVAADSESLAEYGGSGGLKITLKLKSTNSSGNKSVKRKSDAGRQRKRQKMYHPSNSAGAAGGDNCLAWNAVADRAMTPQLDAISTVSDLDSVNADASNVAEVNPVPASSWPSFMQPLDTRKTSLQHISSFSCNNMTAYLRSLEDNEDEVCDRGVLPANDFVIRSQCRVGRGGRIVVDRLSTCKKTHTAQSSLFYPSMLHTSYQQVQYQKQIAVSLDISDSATASASFAPTESPLVRHMSAATAFLSSARELEIYAMSDSEDESVDLPRSAVGPHWSNSMNNNANSGRGRCMTLAV